MASPTPPEVGAPPGEQSIVPVANRPADVSKEVQTLRETLEWFQGNVEVQQARMRDRFSQLELGLRGLEGKMAMRQAPAPAPAAPPDDLQPSMKALAENVSQVSRALREDIEPEIRKQKDAIETLRKQSEAFQYQFRKQDEDVEGLRSQLQTAASSVKTQTSSPAGGEAAQKQQQEAIESLRKHVEELQRDHASRQDLKQELATSRMEHSSQLQALEDLAQSMAGMLKEALVAPAPSASSDSKEVEEVATRLKHLEKEVSKAMEALSAKVDRSAVEVEQERLLAHVSSARQALWQELQDGLARQAHTSLPQLVTDRQSDLQNAIQTKVREIEEKVAVQLRGVVERVDANESRMTSMQRMEGHFADAGAARARVESQRDEVTRLAARLEAVHSSHERLSQSVLTRLETVETQVWTRVEATGGSQKHQHGPQEVALREEVHSLRVRMDLSDSLIKDVVARTSQLAALEKDMQRINEKVRWQVDAALNDSERAAWRARTGFKQSSSATVTATTQVPQGQQASPETTLRDPLADTMPLDSGLFYSRGAQTAANVQPDLPGSPRGQEAAAFSHREVALIREWMDLMRKELASTASGAEERVRKLGEELRREVAQAQSLGNPLSYGLDVEQRLQTFEQESRAALRTGLEQVRADVLHAVRREMQEVSGSNAQERLEVALRAAQAESGSRDRRIWELEVQLRRHVEAFQRTESIEEPLAGLVQGVLKMGEHLGVTPEDSAISALSSDWRTVCVQLPLLVDRACLHSKVPRHTVLLKLLRQKGEAPFVNDGAQTPTRHGTPSGAAGAHRRQSPERRAQSPIRAWGPNSVSPPAKAPQSSSGGFMRGGYRSASCTAGSSPPSGYGKMNVIDKDAGMHASDPREAPPCDDWQALRALKSSPRMPPQLGGAMPVAPPASILAGAPRKR